MCTYNTHSHTMVLVLYFGYGRFIFVHFPPERYCSKRYNSKNLWLAKSSGSVVSDGYFRHVLLLSITTPVEQIIVTLMVIYFGVSEKNIHMYVNFVYYMWVKNYKNINADNNYISLIPKCRFRKLCFYDVVFKF